MSKTSDRSVNILVVISFVLEHCALHVPALGHLVYDQSAVKCDFKQECVGRGVPGFKDVCF